MLPAVLLAATVPVVVVGGAGAQRGGSERGSMGRRTVVAGAWAYLCPGERSAKSAPITTQPD